MNKKNTQMVAESIKKLVNEHPEYLNRKQYNAYIYSISSQSETLLFKLLSKFSSVNPRFRLRHPTISKVFSKLISHLPSSMIHHNGIPIIYFFNKSGKNFIRYVFISLLLREPTDIEYSNYLSMMDSGEYTKIDIINTLKATMEARSHDIKIIGLSKINMVITIANKHLPWFGKLIYNFKKLWKGLRLLPQISSILVMQGQRIETQQQILKEKNDLILKSFSILSKKVEMMKIDSTLVPDDFYLAFENRFRGSRKDITKKLNYYHVYVDEIKINMRSLPFVDLGCGRGEWLELLKKWGFAPIGIDTNSWMVKESKKHTVDVQQMDALNYLQFQKNNSHCGISGFHMLEHIDHSSLIEVIQETYRVLAPGGVAIYETPNPENIIVGACNFYFDLTHNQPLHPLTTQFIFEYVGFTRVQIVRLHPLKFIENNKKTKTDIIANLFNNPQDYAVIAFK